MDRIAYTLPEAARYRRARSDDWSDWHDDVAYCAENIDLLSEREREFLRSLAHWRGELSPKQLDWLAAIAARSRGEA